MRERYPQFYTPTKKQLENLMKSAAIILDTNVLLGLYRSSENTVDELLVLLEAAKKQLWMPYQVGLEYHQGVDGVIAEVRAAHENFRKTLDGALDNLRSSLSDFRHPFIREKVLRELDSLGERLRTELDKPAWGVEELNARQQRIRSRIVGLYDSSTQIGSAFSDDDIAAIVQNGKRRYAEEIPPGYKDAQKPGNPRRPFGDLIIWRELIRYAGAQQIPIVLVSDDRKEDWWGQRVAGKTLGPHPALRAEFAKETGQEFYLYSSEQFLEHGAPLFLERPADADALADAERASRAEDLSAFQRWLIIQQTINPYVKQAEALRARDSSARNLYNNYLLQQRSQSPTLAEMLATYPPKTTLGSIADALAGSAGIGEQPLVIGKPFEGLGIGEPPLVIGKPFEGLGIGEPPLVIGKPFEGLRIGEPPLVIGKPFDASGIGEPPLETGEPAGTSTVAQAPKATDEPDASSSA
jgi:rRNA-processing protein FCF1